MLDLLFKQAHAYAPEDLGIVNIGVAEGKIAYIGQELPPPGAWSPARGGRCCPA